MSSGPRARVDRSLSIGLDDLSPSASRRRRPSAVPSIRYTRFLRLVLASRVTGCFGEHLESLSAATSGVIGWRWNSSADRLAQLSLQFDRCS
jgi:hypothetical protein